MAGRDDSSVCADDMLLQEIENLDTLKGLEQLWLGQNKITELKARSHPILSFSLPEHATNDLRLNQRLS